MEIQREGYIGPDSREEHRRKYKDRRAEIRFEPNKKDRRQNPGRRKEDGDTWKQR